MEVVAEGHREVSTLTLATEAAVSVLVLVPVAWHWTQQQGF